jgi:hypothetical protein
MSEALIDKRHKAWLTNQKTNIIRFIYVYMLCNGFGGLEVACWPLVPKFAGSNPAEAVGFLRAK